MSSGAPSEAALYDDALHIFELVKNSHPKSEIVIIGYSLGSAVAGHVASKTNAPYLVLLAPLHSVERLAKEIFRSFVPSWVVVNKFKLIETAKHIKAETLVICAGADYIIPYSHSEATYLNLANPKGIFTIKNIGHNDIFTAQTTYELINKLLTQTN